MTEQQTLAQLKQKPPWFGGDLQTLAHRIVPRVGAIAGPAQNMRFALGDGSGDQMTGTLHDPGQGGPLVVLMHGVAGSAESVYVRLTARALVAEGRRVLRLNMRAAGASVASCRIPYHCLQTDAIADVFDTLAPVAGEAGLLPVGFSMGGVILLNTLAVHPGRGAVRGAVTVSAPLDLIAASARMGMPRNAVYERALVGELMRLERALAEVWGSGPSLHRPHPRTLRAYDDRFTAPRHGFADADDYYRRASPLQRLDAIEVPVQMLHAADDPWIPAAAYRDLIARPARPDQRVTLTPIGGHVGFHFRGHTAPYYVDEVRRMLSRIA